MTTVNKIRHFTEKDFQKFCSVLLCKHLPEFQAVEGAGGDEGNDGFYASKDVLFQAYAPEKWTCPKLRKKIDESLKKAAALRKKSMPKLKRFVLLTQRDLNHQANLYLHTSAEDHGFEAESWGESKLIAILTEHPEVKSEFPEYLLPDVLEAIRATRTQQVDLERDPAQRRIHLAEEIFTTVSDLADALRPWKGLTISFNELAPTLDRLIPLCWKLHKRALLYLPHEVANDINTILEYVNKIDAANRNHRMYKSFNEGGAYASELNEQFDLARKHYPEQIEKAWENLGSTLKEIVKDSFSSTDDDARYRKWIAAIRPEVLRSTPAASLSMSLDDPNIDLAYRAQKEGDLDLLRFSRSVVLLPPKSTSHNDP